MTINVLFSASDERWANYRAPFEAAFAAAGLDVAMAREFAPDTVDYVVLAPGGGITDFSAFTRARAVMCLWAGVETMVGNPTLTQPLTRMVETGLSEGMREWVTGHVLRHHLGMDAHVRRSAPVWEQVSPKLARARPVTILGLGVLGTACGLALRGLGFPVTGWSRSPKSVEGIRCLSGPEGLEEALRGAEVVVLLVPATPETENLMNPRTLAMPARGAHLLNPGRGVLVDDAALLEALDTGQIGHATLDTFRVEPLPADHPYWHHPHVTVTPHIAAETKPEFTAEVLAENIRRGEAGEPFLHIVDRARGY
ncbi:MAG: glyoxylate/hydroxypyruvate reductase A [Rubellimicrobium sp.]|nr:glyoxylate/hydroxypyruvate reductase A [Rubellimicrobium sp.]